MNKLNEIVRNIILSKSHIVSEYTINKYENDLFNHLDFDKQIKEIKEGKGL